MPVTAAYGRRTDREQPDIASQTLIHWACDVRLLGPCRAQRGTGIAPAIICPLAISAMFSSYDVYF